MGDGGSARPAASEPKTKAAARPSGARFVALGILGSKVVGLLREMVVNRLLGLDAHNDVWRSALRAPNVLQNMLGEQTLSAAFIPVYSRLIGEGKTREAGRLAGAVLGLLTVVVSVLVLLGVALAPWLVAVLTPGFLGDAARVASGELSVDRYALLVRAVRVIFPMTGLLVLSAWALAILNSHRRFLLPYLAPVVWNSAILTALLAAAWRSGHLWQPRAASTDELTAWLLAACFGALVGGLLQLAVQLPLVIRLVRGFRWSVSPSIPGVKDVLSAFGPALAGRGVVQLSLYVDNLLASFLAPGAVAVIPTAGTLMNLPVGVFGMSVAAAELPELSREDPRRAAEAISSRIDRAIRQSAFVICPSVVGYLVFGFLVVGLFFRGGKFTLAANWLTWGVLACYTLGLLASTVSRLLQNSFFALRDTKTPARIAAARLAVQASVGVPAMLILDSFTVASVVGLGGGDVGALYFGACGLALGSSAGAWAELALLVRGLRRRVPGLRLPVAHVGGRLALALGTAVPALALWYLLRHRGLLWQGALVLPAYGLTYLLAAWRLGAPELDLWLGRLGRR
ncbi:MAG: murein biosynthesis integral membrane protein MurJ [Acidobacteriota bacterium]